MNWLALVTLIGGAAVGYLVGATRAHLANARYLDHRDSWMDKQRRKQAQLAAFDHDIRNRFSRMRQEHLRKTGVDLSQYPLPPPPPPLRNVTGARPPLSGDAK